MKGLLVCLLTGFAFSAQAYDLECEKPVTNTQRQYAYIDVWPVMMAQLGVKNCVGGGPVEFCMEQPQDTIADESSLCGYRVNTRWDCQTRQWNDNLGNRIVQTDCPRWNERATLTIATNGRGSLACYNGNHLERRWSLGTCHMGR